MNEKTIKTLEFDKIRKMLANECLSLMSQELAEKLVPTNNPLEVAASQNETWEAVDYIDKTGSAPMHGFSDIREPLHKVRIGLILSPEELLRVGNTLKVSRTTKSVFMKDKSPAGTHMLELAGALVSLKIMEETIERSIESEDRVADGASSALSTIRRKIGLCHVKIRQKLENILRSPKYKDSLMDALVTQRSGRYVVPVKQEHRGKVPGLVHDQSGSGATLFIEPLEVVEINNELRELELQEIEEVQRILMELTDMLRPHGEQIGYALESLAQLDFAFAKARLAALMSARRTDINALGHVGIIRGRHPLIAAESVVPISLEIGRHFTSLLITGPNTGGKTVTLKTVGLFALMTQAGLFIPAEDGCTMPVFDGVFADIGDEQSIEQSLSTFSSHMRNIVSILQEADDGSLVLLDELGAGTDPNEGSALAIAILERLKRSHCRTMATTHYSELKAYAISTAGVENASMEFDVESLRPTYKLTLGIPGKSNAFEISRRLGLPESVIESAREHLSQEIIRFEDVIQSAEKQREAAKREREEAEILHREISDLHKIADREHERLEKQRDKIIADAKEEARKVIEKAKVEAEAAIKEIRLLRLNKGGNTEREIQQTRDKIRAAGEEVAQSIPTERLTPPPKDLKLGELVILLDSQQAATVLTLPDAKGDLSVQAGIMKLSTNVDKLKRANAADRKAENRAERSSKLRMGNISRELDIRGQNSEDGLMEVEHYLDEAMMAGLTEVFIIHGKGTGKLRSAIHDHLRHHPHVKAYRLGHYGEGEDGVTIVTLNQ
jgi:DNA mismatch repair protein MutS2